ncbi:hypothetical protein ACPPVO_52150 [Dactylosporangium sp. McL0621]|uniref:hypothetical protein n=1 Tax=Dactylosporangium sp. McL0621 TaxID=3415678 RepID=UPI003CE781A3
MRAGRRIDTRRVGRITGCFDEAGAVVPAVAPATAARCDDSAACSRVGDDAGFGAAVDGFARRFSGW